MPPSPSRDTTSKTPRREPGARDTGGSGWDYRGTFDLSESPGDIRPSTAPTNPPSTRMVRIRLGAPRDEAPRIAPETTMGRNFSHRFLTFSRLVSGGRNLAKRTADRCSIEPAK